MILNQYCTNATFFLNILQYFQVLSSNYCTLLEAINIEEYIGKEWLKNSKFLIISGSFILLKYV